MKKLYPANVNSPQAMLSSAITAIDTTIAVTDTSVFPPPPNLAVIGESDAAETVLYTAINGKGLIVTRGFEGTAKAWAKNTTIARNFTAYDYNAVRENIDEISDNVDGYQKKLTAGSGIEIDDDVISATPDLFSGEVIITGQYPSDGNRIPAFDISVKNEDFTVKLETKTDMFVYANGRMYNGVIGTSEAFFTQSVKEIYLCGEFDAEDNFTVSLGSQKPVQSDLSSILIAIISKNQIYSRTECNLIYNDADAVLVSAFTITDFAKLNAAVSINGDIAVFFNYDTGVDTAMSFRYNSSTHGLEMASHGGSQVYINGKYASTNAAGSTILSTTSTYLNLYLPENSNVTKPTYKFEKILPERGGVLAGVFTKHSFWTRFAAELVIDEEVKGIVSAQGIQSFCNPSWMPSGSVSAEKLVPEVRDRLNKSYSLDEQDTGCKWIDGKPIYQRTFTVSLGTANTSADIYIHADFDQMVQLEAFANSDQYQIPIPSFGEQSGGHSTAVQYSIAASIQRAAKTIRIRNYNDRSAYQAVATIWYTKTTD